MRAYDVNNAPLELLWFKGIFLNVFKKNNYVHII